VGAVAGVVGFGGGVAVGAFVVGTVWARIVIAENRPTTARQRREKRRRERIGNNGEGLDINKSDNIVEISRPHRKR
jgi:hypothetical protein